MAEFLDRGRAGSNASTFLTRLQVGAALVDGRVLAALYRSRISAGAVALLIVAAAVAVGAALLVSDAGDAVLDWVARSGGGLLDLVLGWFA
jgi:uncharacterized membrane-anchored protein